MGFTPCTETHAAAAKIAPELHVIWQSEKLLYSSQKLKILLFPTLRIRSCGYVNIGMPSKDRNLSVTNVCPTPRCDRVTHAAAVTKELTTLHFSSHK